jgi:hypothetical protein
MKRAVVVSLLVGSLVAALVTLSVLSGFDVFLKRPVPVRVALSTTPLGFVLGRTAGPRERRIQEFIEAWPAKRRGLADAPDLLAAYAVLGASALSLLVALGSTRRRMRS